MNDQCQRMTLLFDSEFDQCEEEDAKLCSGFAAVSRMTRQPRLVQGDARRL